MGRNQETDAGHGQMMIYSGCRRKSVMKLRDWLRTGTLGDGVRMKAKKATQYPVILATADTNIQ